MVQGLFEMFNMKGSRMVDSFELSKNFFNLNKYEDQSGSGMDRILSGLINQVRAFVVSMDSIYIYHVD